jgi:hypothetical protein
MKWRFSAVAENKPSFFPPKYHVANSYEICPLSYSSRSFPGLISRFWTHIECLCFSLISTDVFLFSLSGILASWAWSRFLTYRLYVHNCGLARTFSFASFHHSQVNECSQMRQSELELTQQHVLFLTHWLGFLLSITSWVIGRLSSLSLKRLHQWQSLETLMLMGPGFEFWSTRNNIFTEHAQLSHFIQMYHRVQHSANQNWKADIFLSYHWPGTECFQTS